ncbi:MAG: hypothetical protein HN811_06995, partial [Phycisphaerae bacterium]|nr:hypothetical protein [Phycisphaerae bacterium]
MPYVLRRVDKDDYVALVIELGLKQQWRVKNNGSDAWLGHLNALFTLVGFILLAAAYVPGNRLKAKIGHPMVAGVKIWA